MKRTISIFVCLFMIVTLLIGCGTTAATTTATTAGTTAAPTTTAATTAAPVTLKLSFIVPTDGPVQRNGKRIQYRDGKYIGHNVLQNDYITVLKANLNSGIIPDVFMSSAYADNSTYKDYTYDLTNEDFIKQLEPTVLTA